MTTFQQWDMEIEKSDKEREKITVGIIINFIINLV